MLRKQIDALICAIVVGALSCRSQEGATEATLASGPASAGTPNVATGTGSNPATSAPSGALEITDLGPGRFALEARAPLELDARARIERRSEAGAFELVPLVGGFPLTDGCGAPAAGASDCFSLNPGTVRIPAAWNGGDCAGPCCPKDAPSTGTPSGGVYRLVVGQCGAPETEWKGPEFALPGSTNALYRARAASHMTSATVARLVPGDVVEDLAAHAQRIAGFAVVSGTEIPLPSERLPALAEWLRGESFDDRVVRRCKREDAYGFRVNRVVPGGNEATEIAVDFNCHSVAVVHTEGDRRVRSDAFFDASREPLIAILRSVMPDAPGSKAR